MAPEIIYSETSTGVFEPQPTTAQKRRTKREADKVQRARKQRRDTIVGISVIVVAILLWVAFNVAIGYYTANWPA
jgi:hypothetical protein